MLKREMFYILKDEIKKLGYSDEEFNFYFKYALRMIVVLDDHQTFNINDINKLNFKSFQSKEEFIEYIQESIIPVIEKIKNRDEKGRNMLNARNYSLQVGVRKALQTVGIITVLAVGFKTSYSVIKNAEAIVELDDNLNDLLLKNDNHQVLEVFLENVISNMQKEYLDDTYNEVISKIIDYNNIIKQLNIEIESFSGSESELVKLKNERDNYLWESVKLAAQYKHIFGGYKYEKYADAICINGEVYFPINKIDKITDDSVLTEKDGITYVKYLGTGENIVKSVF